jgi:RNA polymerase sigma-70 factor, ECF subfamily
LSKEIDNNLIEKALKGDSVALSEIYFLLRNSIYGFAYRMLNETAIAEDITQEVFMFFIQNPTKYQPELSSLKTFLCAVTRNKIMHHLRKSGNNLEIYHDDTEDFNEPIAAIDCNPLANLLNQELAEKIQNSISQLSPLLREVVLLREVQGLRHEEIAKITEAEVSAVKVRLYRARRILANRLAPYLLNKEEKFYEMR